MPYNSPVCGRIFRFEGGFLRLKTGLFCALEKANSLLFNRSLASFRLFNIFFESSVYFPQRPGQFPNLFRAFCDGVLHRSTSLAYHNSGLVSRGKMPGKNAGVRGLALSRSGNGLPQGNSRPDRRRTVETCRRTCGKGSRISHLHDTSLDHGNGESLNQR